MVYLVLSLLSLIVTSMCQTFQVTGNLMQDIHWAVSRRQSALRVTSAHFLYGAM